MTRAPGQSIWRTLYAGHRRRDDLMLTRTARWIVAGIAALALAVGGAGMALRGTSPSSPSPPPRHPPAQRRGPRCRQQRRTQRRRRRTSSRLAGLGPLSPRSLWWARRHSPPAEAPPATGGLRAARARGRRRRSPGCIRRPRRAGWSDPEPALRAAPPSPTRRAWRLIKTDPGTVTAATRRHGGQIVGYLNITPQGGDETLANWASFRPAHNREEGDREPRRRWPQPRGLRFRNGHGLVREGPLLDRRPSAATPRSRASCAARPRRL